MVALSSGNSEASPGKSDGEQYGTHGDVRKLDSGSDDDYGFMPGTDEINAEANYGTMPVDGTSDKRPYGPVTKLNTDVDAESQYAKSPDLKDHKRHSEYAKTPSDFRELDYHDVEELRS
jgi:hypothetical protein